nr:xin actin-binding repeat-containing protein 2 isoform X3 [Megalopta genalis]
MAEVATKKSISVVSNKKNEVCGVQSNNGLLDLDNLTASNNQLISLCETNDDEDDLILTNNTRNELDTDDKSLQELIESELALRISSNAEQDTVVETDQEEEDEPATNQPETVKRIVLDRRQDTFDMNTEFIVMESEHCSLIEEPYSYQNGHVSPDTKITGSSYGENAKPEPILTGFREEEEEQVFTEEPEVGGAIVIQKTDADEFDQPARDDGRLFHRSQDEEASCPVDDPVSRAPDLEDRPSEMPHLAVESVQDILSDQVTSATPVICVDKYQEEEEEEEEASGKVLEGADLLQTEITLGGDLSRDTSDTWSEQVTFQESQLAGQFSDNFDQTLCQQSPDSFTARELEDGSSLIQSDKPDDPFEPAMPETGKEEDAEDVNELPVEEESKVSLDDKSSSSVDEKIPEDPEDCSIPERPIDEIEEEAQAVNAVGSRSFDDVTLSNSDASTDAASTQEFIDTERRVLSEENDAERLRDEVLGFEGLSSEKPEPPARSSMDEDEAAREEEVKEEANDNADEQNAIAESSSELSVSEPTFIEKTEAIVSDGNATIFSETKCPETGADSDLIEETAETHDLNSRAPLATPDDETSDVSNACDSESREETITTTSTVVTSSTAKSGTKTKKKKIEGVAGNDASPNLTPRTKKTKKSKKNELEKENISVTQTYVSEATRHEQDRSIKEKIATGVSIKQLCRSFGDISSMSDGDQTAYGKANHAMETEEKSSFNKFDALSKKTVLHVRSIDAGKVQQQLNAAVGQNGDTNPNCRSCGKVVFQMEQTKAEGLVWHKNCFRCVQCSKQLNVDNYESHETILYCKPHFKELFQPKPVEESEQPVRPRKPELIIRENEPKELPPDVIRASDKPDLGLEELSSLNVKSRFKVFEKAGTEANEIERSPSQVAVKRSPSILSKLAKFQAKGMDIGVADESLNGIPYEESSESEEEEELEETEETETEIVKAKRATRERPISFTKMDDIKNRWETTSQQGRRKVQREARKEEIAGIRSRLFMGKQGKMKEMYQQAVAGSDRVTKINPAEELQNSSAHARSIKERFERGELIAGSDDETDNKPKPEKADEEVIAAGISRKSRSLFLELDASAAKTGRPVTPVNPKTPSDTPRRARDAFMGRQVSDDVVRSSDTTEEVQVETSDISNKFKFFESYKEPEKQRKQFRITPPRDGQVKMDSPEREIYRDPDVVRAEDRVDEVVHTDTARKMLSIFRQMEENATKKEVPKFPKPLKRFTPPPEDKYEKPPMSGSEDEEEEEGEESEGEDSTEERDPNYVRASDKVEDEFLKQAQNAARAKTLCAKFEHWDETDAKAVTSSNQHIAEMEIAQNIGEQSSIESASSLRARFESLGSQQTESPRTTKVKVNRFVEIQASCTDVCESCQKKVYPLEKVETNNKIFHKQCFRCLQCNCVLRMDTFTLNNGKLYCIPHFKQLFITRGNYDEGFGVDPHKNKWTTSANNPTSPAPIAVSNGDL